VIRLHHPHVIASDIDATIAFRCDGFGGRVADRDFASARAAWPSVRSAKSGMEYRPQWTRMPSLASAYHAAPAAGRALPARAVGDGS
jgi:catechol 2,3-dioxygenase-like lactoylglutathione lyase family enzyme